MPDNFLHPQCLAHGRCLLNVCQTHGENSEWPTHQYRSTTLLANLISRWEERQLLKKVNKQPAVGSRSLSPISQGRLSRPQIRLVPVHQGRSSGCSSGGWTLAADPLRPGFKGLCFTGQQPGSPPQCPQWAKCGPHLLISAC